MLTEEQNRKLTQVGPGTPMGDLLRRYWHPIAAVGELEETPLKRVGLLGEWLVLYRGTNGAYGVVAAFCAHRQTDLSFGIIEEQGLRCPLHGWLYDATGQCLEQPLEPVPFAHEVKLAAYPVAAKGGMLWAYLGPAPAPLLPDWEPFGWEDGLVQVVQTDLACNWLQCHESSLDPVDAEIFLKAAAGEPVEGPVRWGGAPFSFDEFAHGFVYRRGVEKQTAAGAETTVGRTSVWPNGVFIGDRRSCHFEWRVPVDDASTLNVAWFFDQRVPGASTPPSRVHHWRAPVRDEDGEIIDSHLLNRNFAIWLHQAPIVDRTQEHLVASDRGIVMLRERYLSQMELIEDGGEPKAVLRDPSANRRLHLPFSSVQKSTGRPAPATAQPFRYLAGQPAEVAALYDQVRASWEEKQARARVRAASSRRGTQVSTGETQT